MEEREGQPNQPQDTPDKDAPAQASTPQSKQPTKNKYTQAAVLVALCGAVGFGGGYLGANANEYSASNSATPTINEADQRTVRSESQLISAIAAKVSPSVVSVNVTSNARTGIRTYQQQSAGTGIILNTEGYVVTNRHVVPAGATNVSVTLSDGTTLDKVSVVGRTGSNDSLDIAFLKINDTEGTELTPASIGDSSKVQVGDKVVAIGNALGQFQNTVTDGILSGYGRDIQASGSDGGDPESLQNLFQTDAAINQGNSGGPLLNIDGEVIGINTAVAGEGAQNIGFAIPINDVKGLIESVLRDGKVVRPYLGVRYVPLTDDYAEQNNLPANRGAYILPAEGNAAGVLSGSPADKAGLREKDIITKVGGQAIDDRNSLTSLIGQRAVGDDVEITILRDGKEMTVTATLMANPS